MREFLRIAKKEAEKSDAHQQMSALVIYKGKIISCAHNSLKTNPTQYKINKDSIHSTHAEIAAITRIMSSRKDIDWGRTKLLVYRKRRNQEYGLAKPCPICSQLINQMGIKHLYYTCNDGHVAHELKS